MAVNYNFLGRPPFDTSLILSTTSSEYRFDLPALMVGFIPAVLHLIFTASGVMPRLSAISLWVSPFTLILSVIIALPLIISILYRKRLLTNLIRYSNMFLDRVNMRNEWTDDELILLRENYKNTGLDRISLLFPRHSKKAIYAKVKRLGLHVSKEVRSAICRIRSAAQPSKKKDITGKRFGRLVALQEDGFSITPKGEKLFYWLCRCDCGNTKRIGKAALLSGMTISCGCYNKEMAKKRLQEKAENITGKKYGRLTAISLSYYDDRRKKSFWLFRCDCGTEKVISKQDVTTGNTCSCGCLQRELASKRSRTHNMTGTRIYKIWRGIKERCKDKDNPRYTNYSGRGITVCEEWQVFEPFYEWAMSHGYKQGLTIDRIDNDGNYEPSNCRWATKKEQALNRRSNVRIEYNGKTMTLSEWSDVTGIKIATLCMRHKKGLPTDKIFSMEGIKGLKNAV